MNCNASFRCGGLILVGLLSTILIHTQASATVVDVNVVAADAATDVGPQDGVFDAFDPSSLGLVNNNGFTSLRTALEFDISAVPSGSMVNAATLTMDVNFVGEIRREIALYGYAGDGMISLDDFSLGSLVDRVTLNPGDGQTVVFDATSFLDSLVATGATFAGFNVREDPASPVNAVLAFFLDGGPAPRLSIDFTARVVPAPPGIWLFGSGVLGLLWVKRLRRRRTQQLHAESFARH